MKLALERHIGVRKCRRSALFKPTLVAIGGIVWRVQRIQVVLNC